MAHADGDPHADLTVNEAELGMVKKLLFIIFLLVSERGFANSNEPDTSKMIDLVRASVGQFSVKFCKEKGDGKAQEFHEDLTCYSEVIGQLMFEGWHWTACHAPGVQLAKLLSLEPMVYSGGGAIRQCVSGARFLLERDVQSLKNAAKVIQGGAMFSYEEFLQVPDFERAFLRKAMAFHFCGQLDQAPEKFGICFSESYLDHNRLKDFFWGDEI